MDRSSGVAAPPRFRLGRTRGAICRHATDTRPTTRMKVPAKSQRALCWVNMRVVWTSAVVWADPPSELDLSYGRPVESRHGPDWLTIEIWLSRPIALTAHTSWTRAG